MKYEMRPLDKWPLAKTRDKRSCLTFRSGWGDTLEKLEYELWMLEAHSIVLQVDVPRDQIRLDGMLRANAKVQYPGIILSFESKKTGSLQFPCDSCEFWQHNVRSIALGLEALRAVDRYGITRQAEQYKGWDKLPSPETSGVQIPQTRQEAIDLLVACTNLPPNDPGFAKAAKKELQKSHPDHGGQRSALSSVERGNSIT